MNEIHKEMFVLIDDKSVILIYNIVVVMRKGGIEVPNMYKYLSKSQIFPLEILPWDQ